MIRLLALLLASAVGCGHLRLADAQSLPPGVQLPPGTSLPPGISLANLSLSDLAQAIPSPAPNPNNYTAINIQYQYASVSVCGNPNVPFLQDPQNGVPYFANVNTWSGHQWADWITKDLKDKWIAAAVFTGIAAVSLIILLVWRLVVSGMACCGRAPVRKPPQYLTSTPSTDVYDKPAASGACCGKCGTWWRAQNSSAAMMWLKPFVLLCALVAMGFIIYGLTQASKGLADEAWQQVNAASNQVSVITYQVQYVLSNASTLNAAMGSLEQAAQGLPDQQQAVLQSTIITPVNQVLTNINQLITTYSNQAAQVRADVTGKVTEVEDNHYNTSQDLDKAQYILTIVLFSLGLLFLVLLILAMAFNIPGLFTLSNICSHILLLLYFILTLLMAMALSAAVDACPAAETIIKAVVPANRATLLNYYMFGVGGTVQQVFAASGIIDIPNLETQIAQAAAVLEAADQALTTLGSNDPSVQSLQAAVQQSQATLYNTVAAKNLLLQVSDYQALNPIYVSAKSYACCSVRDTVYNLWLAFTASAWAMLACAWLSNALITQYDHAPGSWDGSCHGCCGCHRLGPFTPQQGVGRQALVQQQQHAAVDPEAAKYANYGNGYGTTRPAGYHAYNGGTTAPPMQMPAYGR